MKLKLLLLTFLTFTFSLTYAQTAIKQYFDGDDTLGGPAIIISIDTSGDNIWQVGPPQKTVFDTPATAPNVIVTDTINTYPKNNTSSFSFGVNLQQGITWGIIAIRWKQKLDMDTAMDGGIVEYSLDSGQTWVNILTDTNVYNLYGFDTANVKKLPDSTLAFTGTDTLWRDIWLCYGHSYLQNYDSIVVRYTFRSDSSDNSKDGWMIDNMLFEETYFHTVGTVAPAGKFLVYPTLTTSTVKIDVTGEAEGIDNIVVTDLQGKVQRRYNNINDVRTQIDMNSLPNGNYYIGIHTKEKIEIHKVIVAH